MISRSEFVEHQTFERDWWGSCVNTMGEESKQISYAYRMGLVNQPIGEHWPGYDLEGKSIVDLGGGPVSLLLKCRNFSDSVVVDPCEYPGWTTGRYHAHGVSVLRIPAEDFGVGQGMEVDEAWLYNVLLHVIDPEIVVHVARSVARTVRIFEWLETAPCPGHPHTLHRDEMERWLGDEGTVEEMTGENGCWGQAFYGVFKGFT